MNVHKNLMIAVLTQMIADYVNAIKIGGLNFEEELNRNRIKIREVKKKKCDAKMLRNVDVMTRGEEARNYIFEDFRESGEYVFGFKFICSYIGLDPEKFWKDIHT